MVLKPTTYPPAAPKRSFGGRGNSQPKRGFTLVEMLVVIGITMLLSGIALGYNRSGNRQIMLFRDRAVIVGLLNRAKALAIQKYRDPTIAGTHLTCAFGLHFDPASSDYIFFRDLGAGSCDAANANYSYDVGATPSEELDTFSLDSRLEFSFSGTVPASGFDILFIPPELIAATTHPGGFPVKVTIQTVGGEFTAPVTVSSIAGQIVTGP